MRELLGDLEAERSRVGRNRRGVGAADRAEARLDNGQFVWHDEIVTLQVETKRHGKQQYVLEQGFPRDLRTGPQYKSASGLVNEGEVIIRNDTRNIVSGLPLMCCL